MNCPHCDKVILVRLTKDDGKANPESRVTSEGMGDVGELIAQIHDDELESDFEIDFMKSLRERFEKWGDRIMMSEKQMICLRKIAAK